MKGLWGIVSKVEVDGRSIGTNLVFIGVERKEGLEEGFLRCDGQVVFRVGVGVIEGDFGVFKLKIVGFTERMFLRKKLQGCFGYVEKGLGDIQREMFRCDIYRILIVRR